MAGITYISPASECWFDTQHSGVGLKTGRLNEPIIAYRPSNRTNARPINNQQRKINQWDCFLIEKNPAAESKERTSTENDRWWSRSLTRGSSAHRIRPRRFIIRLSLLKTITGCLLFHQISCRRLNLPSQEFRAARHTNLFKSAHIFLQLIRYPSRWRFRKSSSRIHKLSKGLLGKMNFREYAIR